ncbi:tol-pal system protein YbgF [bacterium]|nr:tol-pal system protein YbgF [bacterium]
MIRPTTTASGARAGARSAGTLLRLLALGALLAPFVTGCALLTSKAELKVNEIATETRVLRSQQRDLTDEVARIRGLLESEGMVGDEQRAELLVRLDAIERTVAQMVARSEEQDAMLRRMAAAIEQLARQAGLAPSGAMPGASSGAAPAPAGTQSSAPPASTPAAPPAAAPDVAAAPPDTGAALPGGEGSSELAIYDGARGDFARGNYALAREGFEELLRRFPASTLADNAAYWLAESFYAEGQFLQALERYEDILLNYPSGDVVPAALLKTGYCRLELGYTEEGRAAFQRVQQRFPDSNEAAIAAHKLASLQR